MTTETPPPVPALTPFMQLVAHFKLPLMITFNGLLTTVPTADRGAILAAMGAAMGEILSEASAAPQVAITLSVRKKTLVMFTEALQKRVPALSVAASLGSQMPVPPGGMNG